MSFHRDPTASAAIGAVDREIRRARRAAYRLQEAATENDRFVEKRKQALRTRYTGLTRFLLDEAIDYGRY